jgi:hypothetical protein
MWDLARKETGGKKGRRGAGSTGLRITQEQTSFLVHNERSGMLFCSCGCSELAPATRRVCYLAGKNHVRILSSSNISSNGSRAHAHIHTHAHAHDGNKTVTRTHACTHAYTAHINVRTHTYTHTHTNSAHLRTRAAVLRLLQPQVRLATAVCAWLGA